MRHNCSWEAQIWASTLSLAKPDHVWIAITLLQNNKLGTIYLIPTISSQNIHRFLKPLHSYKMLFWAEKRFEMYILIKQAEKSID